MSKVPGVDARTCAWVTRVKETGPTTVPTTCASSAANIEVPMLVVTMACALVVNACQLVMQRNVQIQCAMCAAKRKGGSFASFTGTRCVPSATLSRKWKSVPEKCARDAATQFLALHTTFSASRATKIRLQKTAAIIAVHHAFKDGELACNRHKKRPTNGSLVSQNHVICID